MTGRSLYLYLVLNWNQVKRTPIPRKDVFNRGFATTEGEVYSDEPREHVLICRLTSAEKASLYDIDNEQAHIQIMENLTNHGRCWISSITVDYKIVEHADAPWVVTINLVEVGVPLLDADIDIDIAFSDEPPIFIVWHQVFSDEPPLWVVWHPAISDEPNIGASLHSCFSDESWIHAGLCSAFISGNDAFWGGVGYPSAC